jgi:DNA-binding CsgD family transcriptional regulator
MYCTPGITEKERIVLQLIGNGFSSKQIAGRLHISFHTAETHRKHLLEKFEAGNTAELIKKATKVYWLE